jgi:hypothetical protein
MRLLRRDRRRSKQAQMLDAMSSAPAPLPVKVDTDLLSLIIAVWMPV